MPSSTRSESPGAATPVSAAILRNEKYQIKSISHIDFWGTRREKWPNGASRMGARHPKGGSHEQDHPTRADGRVRGRAGLRTGGQCPRASQKETAFLLRIH